MNNIINVHVLFIVLFASHSSFAMMTGYKSSSEQSRSDDLRAIKNSPFSADIWQAIGKKSDAHVTRKLRSTCKYFANSLVDEKIQRAISCDCLGSFVSYYASVDPGPVRFANLMIQHQQKLSLHRSYIPTFVLLFDKKDKHAITFMLERDPLGLGKEKINRIKIVVNLTTTDCFMSLSGKENGEYLELFEKWIEGEMKVVNPNILLAEREADCVIL